jgi:probable HAF family extracellular repeat protein
MATAINASGQVVGTSALPNDSGSNTFLYSRGTMTDLSALGSQSAPTAINDSGQIVGYYNSGGLDQAFLYSGGTVADLNPLVGPSPSVGALGAEATGINDSRQILGYASPGEDANSYPFIYSGGSATMLGTLPGTSGLTYFSTGINSFGQAVGYAYRNGEPGTSHAFLYSQGAMIDIRPPSATVTDIEPNDINDSGQVVGEEDTDTTTNHAFLYSGGVMTDLNSLVVGSGWTLVDATGINDSGQIVGYGIDPSGNGEAFLLSPVSVPEPGGLVLLAFLG